MPCETVFKCLEDPERSPAQHTRGLVRNARNAEFSSCWGPVDRIDEIEPLHDDEAREVIDRRFGLYRRIVEVERG